MAIENIRERLTRSDYEFARRCEALRLRGQLAADTTAQGVNRMNPAQLNEVDRRILKESFRQVRKLQSRLALDYQL